MKALASIVVVLLMAASAFAQYSFKLTADNPTPASGDTVTFTLSYQGSEGLILARFDAGLSGTGTWNAPSSVATLVAALENHATATAGTPGPGGVDDVVLAINYQSFPWSPANIGLGSEVDIWQTQVQVFGSAGDVVSLQAVSELHPDAGAHAFFSAGGAITAQTTLAGTSVQIVPEPATIGLIAVGGASLLGLRRRRRRA